MNRDDLRVNVKGLNGADRDRTDDLLNAIQALSQLSYSPFKNFTQVFLNDDLPDFIGTLSSRRLSGSYSPKLVNSLQLSVDSKKKLKQ